MSETTTSAEQLRQAHAEMVAAKARNAAAIKDLTATDEALRVAESAFHKAQRDYIQDALKAAE